ncbi:MAG: hypothetical protein AAGI34_07335 [Pseudomonadota bacterium]
MHHDGRQGGARPHPRRPETIALAEVAQVRAQCLEIIRTESPKAFAQQRA